MDDSLAAMDWIKPADAAAVALARGYAVQIDAVLAAADLGDVSGTDVTKALYLGPHLLNALRALGATPDGRASLDLTEKVEGALSGIRARRATG